MFHDEAAGEGADTMADFVAELKRAAENQAYLPVVPTRQAIEAQTPQVTYIVGLRNENVSTLENKYGVQIKVVHGIERRGESAMSRIIVDGFAAKRVNEAVYEIHSQLYLVRTPQQVQVKRESIGKVIGRSGERIKEIQQVSGVTSTIDQRYDPCLVEIKGNPTSILAAIDLINASIEGRYASTLNRYSQSSLNQAALTDPYKEIDRNWLPARDEKGQVYWYNPVSGKTQWNNPFLSSS
mmetsp:Transcript_17004/g.25604  ORF Transcript_17004/g.25604 Transcript_17004/m.25604 type:complete len:239 (+) Transcript_17004:35-751(+)